jgi:hypothetical protein
VSPALTTAGNVVVSIARTRDGDAIALRLWCLVCSWEQIEAEGVEVFRLMVAADHDCKPLPPL